MHSTRTAMKQLGQRCAAARPEVIVVATPHGVRVEGTICLAAVARAAGTLGPQAAAVSASAEAARR